MKKFISCLVILVMLLCAVGCSTATPTDSNEKIEVIETFETGVIESHIESDITSLDFVSNGVINGYFMPTEKYELDNISISKRQTNLDKKEDLIFCSVTISNNYVESILEYKLEYNYYDQGGWILDETKLINKQSKPLKGVTESLVYPTSVTFEKMPNYDNTYYALRSYTSSHYDITQNYVPSKFNFKKHETDLENKKDTLFYTYTDHHYEMLGCKEFTFDQSYGWVPTSDKNKRKDNEICLEIRSVTIDWESALNGLFAVKTLEEKRNLKLYEFNGNTLFVDFYDEYSKNVQYVSAKKALAKFNPTDYSISFTATHYYKFSYSDNPYSERNIILVYNFKDDIWHGGQKYDYRDHIRIN